MGTRKPSRKRLPAEEARERILEVAERHLVAVGPGGLRLQGIARELGISHPAILHHFGTREGLVQAVVTRALSGFEARLGALLQPPGPPPGALLQAVSDFFVEGGRARLFAWLALSGGPPPAAAAGYQRLARLVHEARPASARRDFDDTLFRVQLATLALVAEVLFGSPVRRLLGQRDDAGAADDFRRRLRDLLLAA